MKKKQVRRWMRGGMKVYVEKPWRKRDRRRTADPNDPTIIHAMAWKDRVERKKV